MLVQSHQGFIRLLPALPATWPNGWVKGLVAQGRFQVGIAWTEGKVERVEILSKRGNLVRLKNPFIGRGGEITTQGIMAAPDALARDIIEIKTRPGDRVVFSLR